MPDYDRFVDLHITGANGYYDFPFNIEEQLRQQTTAHPEKLPFGLNLSVVVPYKDSKEGALLSYGKAFEETEVAFAEVGVKAFPPQGILALWMSITDIEAHEVSAMARGIVAWLNDAEHVGKLRINCHGDGNGNIGMADGPKSEATAVMHYVRAAELVTFLLANGLSAVDAPLKKDEAGDKKTKGLITISLAVCMGARYGTVPANFNWTCTSSLAAPGSAVSQVVLGLREQKLTGIEVTGCNEITIMNKDGRIYSSPGVGISPTAGIEMERYKNGMGFIFPKNWELKSYTFTKGGYICIPKAFLIEPILANRNASPSAGWTLTDMKTNATVHVSEGWILDVMMGTIIPPHGWGVKSYWGGGGKVYLEADNVVQATSQPLAKSALKVREIS